MQQRRRFKNTLTLAERLARQAADLRNLAREAGSDIERDALLNRAAQYDGAKHMDGYLRSHELQPPEK